MEQSWCRKCLGNDRKQRLTLALGLCKSEMKKKKNRGKNGALGPVIELGCCSKELDLF